MFKKIFSLFLLILMLFSTAGVVINLHFSHHHLYSAALYAPAKSCCTGSAHHQCSLHKQQTKDCSNKSLQIKIQDAFNVVSDLDVNQLGPTHVLIQALNNTIILENITPSKPVFINIPLKLPSYNSDTFLALNQQFLI